MNGTHKFQIGFCHLGKLGEQAPSTADLSEFITKMWSLEPTWSTRKDCINNVLAVFSVWEPYRFPTAMLAALM
jgi:hypothetical protein